MFLVNVDFMSGLQGLMDKLEPNGKAQVMFSNELMKLADEYVPLSAGTLKNSAYVDKGGTAIVYDTPYARYHWFGKLMVDPIYNTGAFFKEGYGFWSRPGVQKVLTDIDLKYNGAPKRGPYWVERAFIDNEQQLTQSLIDYITRFDE